MKLTNITIYNLAKTLIEVFQDSNQYLPIKLNFFIQRNKKTLLDLAQGIDEARLAILQHYGTYNPQTNEYTIPPESLNIVNKELEDLFTLEQEINIHMVKIEDIPEDISLTTGQMEAIMFMIE